jgi:hypothetical protein
VIKSGSPVRFWETEIPKTKDFYKKKGCENIHQETARETPKEKTNR